MISSQKSTSSDIKETTSPHTHDVKKSGIQYTVSDAITTIKCGVMALALAEYYEFKSTNIIGISPGDLPRFFFDKEGFDKLCKNKLDNNIILCKESNSALLPILEWQLKQFHELKIFKKFPYFFKIINENNYINIDTPIANGALLERCHRMQMMWQQWNDTGLPHIISSLQALQRHVSLKMKSPLSPDFELDLKNGLSVEYQAEIYANHLYGAKLLDAWHAYLVSSEPTNKQPQLFLDWLKSLPTEKLTDYGIQSLDEIPIVQYISDINERSQWLLQISPEKIIKNDHLPIAKKVGEELEIIYALGKSNSPERQFFGGIKKRGTINHSTFFGGEKVDGAGRFLLKAEEDKNGSLNWVIHEVDNNSGHIKPDDEMSMNILETLKSLGCDLNSIIWKSKWGSPGVCDETAAMAYKRLTNHCENINLSYFISDKELTTPFLKKLNESAELGLLGDVDDMINTHAMIAAEVVITAILVKKALEKHLRILGLDSAHPSVAASIAKQASQCLRMVGKKSMKLETDLEHIIKHYQSNFDISTQSNFSFARSSSGFFSKNNDDISTIKSLIKPITQAKRSMI